MDISKCLQIEYSSKFRFSEYVWLGHRLRNVGKWGSGQEMGMTGDWRSREERRK